MARIGTAYLEIDGDLSPLNRKLAQLRAKEGRIEVKVDIDRGSFASAAARKAALGGEEEVDLRANVDFSSFARARAAQAVLTKESAKLGDVFNRSQLSIGQWTGILAASAPVILDVAGALGALTASLGAATAGLGAMAAGAGGAAAVGFGGIAAIAAPAISSLTDLMTAQEAADKARVTGAGAAARASTASAQQIQAAEQQLQSTQRSAEIAQESLTAAREEATRQLQDMRRAALGADESEESARIGLRQAVLELQRVNGDLSSSALDVRTAENDVALARNNLRDVTIDGSRAVKDYREAQRGGVKEMPQVVAAQRALDDANRDVADAVQNLAYQQKQANEAAAAGGTTMAALALAQKKAGPAAVKFAGHIKDLGDRWRALTREGRNDFFGMLDDGVTRLNQKLPLLARSANKSMDALRGGFSQFLDRATGPEFNKFIDVMTRTFTKSIGPVSRAFGNIAKVLQRIAVAVAPDIVQMAKDFEGMTEGWLDSTKNAGKLRETVHELVGHTKAWWNLLVAAKDLIVAALVPGMKEGKGAVEDMTGQLKEWTNWINAHPKETRDFFKEAMETTKQLAQTLLSFIPTLFQISTAMRPLARAVLGILKGLNSLKIGNVSALTGLLGVFLGAKLIRGIQGVAAAFTAMKTAALGASGAAATATRVPAAAGGVLLPGAGSTVAQRAQRATTAGGGIAGGISQTYTKVGRTAGTSFMGGLRTRLSGMKGVAKGIGFGVIGTSVISGIATAFSDTGLKRDFGESVQDFFSGATLGAIRGSEDAAREVSETTAELIKLSRPGATVPEGAATIFPDLQPGKIESTAEALKRLAAIRKEMIPDLLKEGDITEEQAAILADYASQQAKLIKQGDFAVPIKRSLAGLARGVIGGKEALGGLNKVLDDISTKTAQGAIDGLREKYGGLVAAGHQMSKKQRAAFENMMRVAREHGDVTARQLQRVTDAFDDNTRKWERMMARAAEATGQSTKDMKRAVGDMTVTVSKDYKGMVRVTGGGIEWLTSNTNRALEELGIRKEIQFKASRGRLGLPGVKQRGGHIGGTGIGDTVPTMLEPGEFVVNKKATQVARPILEELNRKVPRFQTGGLVDRTGVQHFARGGMAAMVAEANKFEAQHFPYVWGGGHGSFGIQPVDCSGAVSQILHAAGLLNAPMVSGALASWGKPGKGPLTVYANPVHTLMSLGGRFFGTSSSNPGGGAGWIQGGFDQGYLSGFAARTMDAVGAATRIARVLLKGPKGPLRDIGQGHLDKVHSAANKFIASKMGGAFGGGQGLKDFSKGPGKIVGASVYGFGEPGTGTVGASGVSLPGKPAFAELEMGNALGGLPFGKKLGIEVGGKRAVGVKLDIGAGGGAVAGHPRAIDFWRDLAQDLGVSGSFLGLAKVKGLQRGGVAPYLGAFHQGGPVLRDGFGLLKRGEEVISKQQGGIIGPTHWAWMMNEIRRLRTPHPLRERREQRREERREERRREREAERRRLARLQRETREETRARHRQEQRAERRQHERKERREARELERLLIEQTKELRQDIKEHNRLYRQVRGREKVALQGLASFVGSEIGAKGQEKRRLASAGSVARY